MRDIICQICQKEFQHWQWAAKYCSKTCYHKSEYKKYRKKYLDKDYQLKKSYGISLDEYNSIKETQENKCLICFKTPKKLYVDHCHQTGNIRGLLCLKCNLLLGHAEDNIKILKIAINYLELADLKAAKGIK